MGQHHRRHRPDPAAGRRPRARAHRPAGHPGRRGQSSARAPTARSGSSAERTSPYAFYQYWINVDDRDVERFLLQLTLLPVAEAVAALRRPTTRHPDQRHGQRRLAHEVTALVHGEAARPAAAAALTVLFGGDPAEAPASTRSRCWTAELAVGHLAGDALDCRRAPSVDLVDGHRAGDVARATPAGV